VLTKVRGYEYAKGAFIQVEDDELDAIAIESNHTIEIARSFRVRRLMNGISTGGQDAFVVIRDAMRGKDMVALARVVLAKRERVIMLQPWDKGLMAVTLRYAYEVRDSKDFFDEIPDVKLPSESSIFGQLGCFGVGAKKQSLCGGLDAIQTLNRPDIAEGGKQGGDGAGVVIGRVWS
jgi:Ku protein